MAPPSIFPRWLSAAIMLLADGFHALSSAIPALLLLNFAISAWLVGHFSVNRLILPFYMENDWSDMGSLGLAATGIAALSLYAVLLFFALGSCLVLWYRSFILCHFESTRFPASANTGRKRTMQWYRGFEAWYDRRHDPNQKRRLDRAYAEGRGEFAVLDHYCPWLWTPVCLQTIKPYLLVLVYVPLHQTFVLAFLSWSVSRRSWRNTIFVFAVLAVFFPLLILWLKLTPIVRKWRMLALENRTAFEYRHFVHRKLLPAWEMMVWDGNRLWYDTAHYNPWDLGSWQANCRAALGDHIWQWPLFWVQPSRVHQYGLGDESDLPLGARWLNHIGTRIGRASEAPDPAPLPAAVIRNRVTYSSEF